jgi:hypothetical protein
MTNSPNKFVVAKRGIVALGEIVIEKSDSWRYKIRSEKLCFGIFYKNLETS